MPLDYDASYLDGVRLEQVAVGEFQVILNFDGASLSIEGEMQLVHPDGTVQRFALPFDAAPALLPLLKHPVAHAEVVGPVELSITFGDGSRLSVFDSTEPYEQFSLQHGPHLLIV
ncbi:DUF6188 family protein [Aquihabitans sp. McL0605]|uniref:DUF6188 family protein n=1 Tax=Aquihabitans sp. McL0605 TaxID=3415671 RepID=UPI003CED66B7